MVQTKILSLNLKSDLTGFLNWDPVKSYSFQDALDYCANIARSHYENFTVGSFLIPKTKRQHIYNVYAFCRWADDLGDEIKDPEKSIELLRWWKNELEACYKGKFAHPVFIALHDTINQFNLHIEPFKDLIHAFTMDQTKSCYETFEELCEYSKYSANPVGRTYLQLFGYKDEERFSMSDATCTALQLTNFWQDVTIDLEKGRVYLPQKELKQAGYSEDDLKRKRFTPAFRSIMKSLVERTRMLFNKGLPLIKIVDKPVKLDIELFSRGGMAILDRIEAQHYDVLSKRPKLGKTKKLLLLFSRLFSI